jgi:hypothetical protein
MPTTTLEDVVERAAEEGLPTVQIARIVGMTVEEITPYIQDTVTRREELLASAMRFKTSELQGRMLLALLKTGTMSRETLVGIAGTASTDVLIHKLRQRLNAWGLTIHTVHGVGYQMTAGEVEKARAILRGETP